MNYIMMFPIYYLMMYPKIPDEVSLESLDIYPIELPDE